MDFYLFINEKVSDWLKSGRSETQLAKEIGINQATLNAWKNKTRGIPKDEKIIQSLLSYFGNNDPRIYDVLHRPQPSDPRSILLSSGFPVEFVDELLAARSEYTEELSKKGITQDSPEAREIVRAAFARHGIHITDTE